MAPCPPEMFLACVLRGVDGTWAVLDDTGHKPYGVSHVTAHPTSVRVHYSTTIGQIAAIQATPDDTYVRNRYMAGVSGGLSYAVVVFSDENGPINPVDACLPGSNVWITGWAWPSTEQDKP
jgi:hypothetical protein